MRGCRRGSIGKESEGVEQGSGEKGGWVVRRIGEIWAGWDVTAVLFFCLMKGKGTSLRQSREIQDARAQFHHPIVIHSRWYKLLVIQFKQSSNALQTISANRSVNTSQAHLTSLSHHHPPLLQPPSNPPITHPPHVRHGISFEHQLI